MKTEGRIWLKFTLSNLCCRKGKVILPMSPAHAESLHSLFTENTPLAKYFQRNIRLFNLGMAMALVKVIKKTILRYGPALFKVSGKMY